MNHEDNQQPESDYGFSYAPRSNQRRSGNVGPSNSRPIIRDEVDEGSKPSFALSEEISTGPFTAFKPERSPTPSGHKAKLAERRFSLSARRPSDRNNNRAASSPAPTSSNSDKTMVKTTHSASSTSAQAAKLSSMPTVLDLTDIPRIQLGQRAPLSLAPVTSLSYTPNLDASKTVPPLSPAVTSCQTLTTENSRPDTPRPPTSKSMSTSTGTRHDQEQAPPQIQQQQQQKQNKEIRKPFLEHRQILGFGTTSTDQSIPVQHVPTESLVPNKRKYEYPSGTGRNSREYDDQDMASDTSISHLQLSRSNSKPSSTKRPSVPSPPAWSGDHDNRMLSLREIDNFSDAYKRDIVGRDKALRDARTYVDELKATMKHRVQELTEIKRHFSHLSQLGEYLLQNRAENEKSLTSLKRRYESFEMLAGSFEKFAHVCKQQLENSSARETILHLKDAVTSRDELMKAHLEHLRTDQDEFVCQQQIVHNELREVRHIVLSIKEDSNGHREGQPAASQLANIMTSLKTEVEDIRDTLVTIRNTYDQDDASITSLRQQCSEITRSYERIKQTLISVEQYARNMEQQTNDHAQRMTKMREKLHDEQCKRYEEAMEHYVKEHEEDRGIIRALQEKIDLRDQLERLSRHQHGDASPQQSRPIYISSAANSPLSNFSEIADWPTDQVHHTENSGIVLTDISNVEKPLSARKNVAVDGDPEWEMNDVLATSSILPPSAHGEDKENLKPASKK
ncbi:hypothetical protein BCR43DRAFT_541302 [Syncephalastrum racemosum]|uniref:Uncharacterized protein n=1 Tax=Syncephalastrum racemosum TaxID=13706 RepID=A0A1X2HNG0_SYNRA|nr:hypothetical protein BCR43DRAFT_541302 [Syncephalastrum racemosum]